MLRNCWFILSTLSAAGICWLTNAFLTLTWLWVFPVSLLGSLVVWGLLYFLVLWISCALVDIRKPQEADSKYYRFLASRTADFAFWILRMRVHTRGLEKCPKNGRYLLVCNHIHNLDPVLLVAYFKHTELAFISKWENTSMFLVGKLMHKLQCQLINRENDREALRTIITCIKMIQDDKASIGVFPEGYTSMDGLLHPFRSGVFKIALKANVPIVVCTIQNTNKVFKNIKKLKATDVHLHILDVLQPEQLNGMTAVDVGNLVHDMMAKDLGLDLVLQEVPDEKN